MAKKYLDDNGLLYFWQKIKNAFVPTSRTVNGHALSSDVTVTASDIGVESGAEVNVQADWNVTDTSSDAYIKNKPTIPAGSVVDSALSSTSENAVQNKVIYSALEDKAEHAFGDIKVTSGGATYSAQLNKKETLHLDAGTGIQLSYSNSVTNTKKVTITWAAPSSHTKGTANGICPLDANAKVAAQYLPSYVDDVIEAYARSGQTELSSTWLATESASGTVITPETGKIYVLMNDSTSYAANSQFRWSGSAYVKLADGGVSEITNAEIDTIVAS